MNGDELDGAGLGGADWDGLPVAVTPGSTVGLVAAYREASEVAAAFAAVTAAAGLEDAFPELAAGVDADGCAVVRIGRVSPATAYRLAALVRRGMQAADRRGVDHRCPNRRGPGRAS